MRRPSRQNFGFNVAASSGPIPKAPGSAGGYLLVRKAAGFSAPEFRRYPILNRRAKRTSRDFLFVKQNSLVEDKGPLQIF